VDGESLRLIQMKQNQMNSSDFPTTYTIYATPDATDYPEKP